MFKIIATAVALTILALADGSVLQTGQTKSYNADGDVVLDGSVKDDGYYRAGVARSYSRSGDVVIDNATGLQWQDNVDSVEKPWLTQANYDAGNYYNTSGDTARTYCGNLLLYYNNAYYYDWRLPSIHELLTLVDYGRNEPSTTQGIFNHVSSNYLHFSDYWSTTTYAKNTAQAWHLNFRDGGSYGDSSKTFNYYVRCVRGGQSNPSPSNLSRSGEIVTDRTSGLQWQDNSAAKSIKVAWEDAIDYCENTLTLGGYSDWRLPNQNELRSIVEYGRHSPAVDTSVFHNTTLSKYWSSTTMHLWNEFAWHVSFNWATQATALV